ncbi:lipopolysaccharide biosynthesis protein [Flavobacterium panacagri]|uniref:lipopolysaccharide biosynthesis protein n=1 Tax=Flavobacterium panacagri TaxID=3034146 RepID=UPI0025A59B4D|nr:lipopolysaccharide biosynthesis protein [Flavobacterium panacagri]
MDNKSIVENEEITFKELLQKGKDWYSYIRLQWKIILLAGIMGSSIGLLYSFLKKPIYTASLSFALEDDKAGGGLGGALGLASSFGLDLGGSGGGGVFSGSNLTEFFKSRSMVEKTLLSNVNVDGKEISLAEMYIQTNRWRENWKKDLKLSKIQFLPNSNRKSFTRLQDSILGVLYNDLLKEGFSVGQRDKKVSIIYINVSSKNELFAKYFCETLAKEVGEFYIETKSKKARINMSILDRQVDSIRNELNGAITGVAIANDNTFNLNPALNVRRTPSARRQVDVQANTAILTELVKQSELAKVTLRKDTPLIQIIDKPILPLPKEKFEKTKGLLMGGFLGSFIVILFFVFRRVFTDLIR